MSTGFCRTCGAPVIWIVTPHGKRMPLDPPVLTVVTAEGRTVRGRVSHFATCPQADQHRKGR